MPYKLLQTYKDGRGKTTYGPFQTLEDAEEMREVIEAREETLDVVVQDAPPGARTAWDLLRE